MITDVIFLAFLISFFGLIIGIVRPSSVGRESRKAVLKLFGFILLLSFLGIGLTAPRVDVENKAVVQSQQEQANSDIGSEKQNEANVEESDNEATDANNSEQAGEVKAEATDNSAVDIPYKYQAEFKEAQKSAQDNKRGLWSPDTCSGNTTPIVVTPTVTTPKPTAPVSSVSPSVPAPATPAAPANTSSQTQSTGKYYTSSFHTSKYYYTEACDDWKSLSKNYLRSYDTLEALLAVYPTKTLSPQCK